MALSLISSKGQITIPAELRRKLKLYPGTKLEIVEEEGRIVLVPVEPFRKLRGSVKPRKGDERQSAQRYVSYHVVKGE